MFKFSHVGLVTHHRTTTLLLLLPPLLVKTFVSLLGLLCSRGD
jgi:hypothetical protein